MGPSPPENPGAERRLAAILAADIQGYSQLVGRDEEATVARVTRQLSAICAPIVEQHGGRIFKTTGDGFLAIFNNALDAMRCALAFQKRAVEESADLPSDQRLQYRVGIHVGDVIATGADFYGDSVNIASRVERAAEAGGICISESVYVQVRNKLACRYTPLGDKRFRNIADAIPVYAVAADAAPAAPRWRRARPAIAAVLLLALAAAGWASWRNWWVLRSSDSPAQDTSAQTSGPPSVDAAQAERRATVFRRMVAAMQNDRFDWRTVERLAIESGVNEAEAHDILAEHPGEVVLGKSRDGKLIARLADR